MPNELERLTERLRATSKHIASGREHIATVERNLAELSRDGHDTTSAEELLATLRETQGLHEADRENVLREMEILSRGSPWRT